MSDLLPSGTPPPRILPMRRHHLPQVLAIETQCHDRPWSGGLFESEMAAAGRHYLTAWSGGVPGVEGGTGGEPPHGLLGYGGIMLAVDEVHITNVAVDPRLRRRSIGSALVVALLEEAQRRGAVAATLEVRASNHGAQQLYSGFGFAPVGVRPGYYAATRTGTEPDRGAEDAIIMWLHDLDGPGFGARLAARRQARGLDRVVVDADAAAVDDPAQVGA